MQEKPFSAKNFRPDPDKIGQKLNETLVNSQDKFLLANIARDLGEAYQADLCLVIGSYQSQQTPPQGLWQADNSLGTWEMATLTQILSHSLLKVISAGVEPILEGLKDILPYNTLLIVPSRLHSQTKGSIVLGYFADGQETSKIKRSLNSVTGIVAIALEKIELQQQVQLDQIYHTLLKKLSHAMSKDSDLETIYDLVISQTSSALNLEQSWLFFLNYRDPFALFQSSETEKNTEIEAKAICHWSSETNKSNLFSGSDHLAPIFPLTNFPLLAKAWSNAPEPETIEDILSLDFSQQQAPEFFDLASAPGVMITPLMSKTTPDGNAFVLGLLLWQRPGQPWLTKEIELVNAIAVQISNTIHNHRTVRRVQSLVDERTAQLESSLKMRDHLLAKTRQQAKHLIHLNQLKDEFLSTIQHELNTPLTSMRMVIENLRRLGHSPEFQDKYDKYLNILEEQWYREKNLIQDLLKFREIENLENHERETLLLHAVDLSQLITEVTAKFKGQWQTKGLDLTTSFYCHGKNSLTLQSDPESLRRILTELLTNASKFADPQTTIQISARNESDHQGKRVIITVANQGISIPISEQEAIFQTFYRGEGVTNRATPGIGLGLALVDGLVQQIDGTIRVFSQPIAKSQSAEISFQLTLPQ